VAGRDGRKAGGRDSGDKLGRYRAKRSGDRTPEPFGGVSPTDESPEAAPAPGTTAVPYNVRLEITPEWCKSCDICVKLCPERCLALNAERVVELAKPDKCTGCRLCEWLCPDFAIRVHLDPVTAPSGRSA